MFCQECGQKLADGTKFCPYCGAKIQAAPPPVEETTGQEETVEVRPEPEEEAPPSKESGSQADTENGSDTRSSAPSAGASAQVRRKGR